jgi:HSP20 family protein
MDLKEEKNMSITRFDPFRQVSRLQDRMNTIFEDFLGRKLEEADFFAGAWAPPVDILEDANDMILRAELPGLKAEDVDIRIENNTLTLRGERKLESKEDSANYHRRERSYGAFSRSFSLPSTVQQEKVAAEFKDGILQVTLPKREETKPKQISIKVK